MDFRDAWLYSDFIYPQMSVPLIKKGVPKEKVKEIVAGWRQLADMYRLQKAARLEAAEELARQGKINIHEFKALSSRYVRDLAKKENFDYDKAQNRFLKKSKQVS